MSRQHLPGAFPRRACGWLASATLLFAAAIGIANAQILTYDARTPCEVMTTQHQPYGVVYKASEAVTVLSDLAAPPTTPPTPPTCFFGGGFASHSPFHAVVPEGDCKITLMFTAGQDQVSAWVMASQPVTLTAYKTADASGAAMTAGAGSVTSALGNMTYTKLIFQAAAADKNLIRSVVISSNPCTVASFAMDDVDFQTNPPIPTATASSASVTEGDANDVTLNIPVKLDAPSTQTIVIGYTIMPGTATAGTDYVGSPTGTSGTVTFSPGGPLTQNIPITVKGDLIDEPDETILITLQPAPNSGPVIIAPASMNPGVVGTIKDNDGPPSITVNSVSQLEGTIPGPGTTPFTFTMTMSGPVQGTVTVPYTVDSTPPGPFAGTVATPGTDYANGAGTVQFAPGDPLTKTFTVNVVADNILENNETFFVHVGQPNPPGVTVTGPNPPPLLPTVLTPEVTGTIIDDDTAPVASINQDPADPTKQLKTALNEGNAGNTPFPFTITLSNGSAFPVKVYYKTVDGTATTADNDYTGIAQADNQGVGGASVTFAPGDPLTKTVNITVKGDTKYELDENFFVNIYQVPMDPASAQINPGQAIAEGDILNDDGIPCFKFSADPAKIPANPVPEGNSSSVAYTYTVELSNPSYQTVTVAYKTADGTATTADNDYQSSSGTLTFNPGEVSKTFTVTVLGDTKYEPDENFSVMLYNGTNNSGPCGNEVILQGIKNDDPVPQVTINDVSKNEGSGGGLNSFDFTVTLSNPSYLPVTVNYATSDGPPANATANSDYLPATGSLVFPAGSTTPLTISVQVMQDNTPELDENFTVTLSTPVNALLGAKSTGKGTIRNDDYYTLYADRDLDGYGNPNETTQSVTSNPIVINGVKFIPLDGDCDDTKDWIHPGAPERLNGIDDNCDGQIDEAFAGSAVYCGGGAAIHSSPVANNSIVYYGDDAGKAHAVSSTALVDTWTEGSPATPGKQLGGGKILARPGVWSYAGQTAIFFLTESGKLVKMNPDGSIAWQVMPPGALGSPTVGLSKNNVSSPIVDPMDGGVIVGLNDNFSGPYVAKFDWTDGHMVVVTPGLAATTGSISSAALDGTNLYIGVTNGLVGNIYVLQAGTLVVRSTFAYGEDVTAPPLVVRSSIPGVSPSAYVPTKAGNYYKINAITATLDPTFGIGGKVPLGAGNPLLSSPFPYLAPGMPQDAITWLASESGNVFAVSAVGFVTPLASAPTNIPGLAGLSDMANFFSPAYAAGDLFFQLNTTGYPMKQVALGAPGIDVETTPGVDRTVGASYPWGRFVVGGLDGCLYFVRANQNGE